MPRSGRQAIARALLLVALSGGLAGCDARGTSAGVAASDGGGSTTSGSPATPAAIDIRGLAEGSYVGVVKVRVVPPEGSGMRPTSRNGTAGAGLDKAGRLVVVGDVDKDADAGFAADGRFEGAGWRGGTGEVELRIDGDGAIRGGGVAGGNRMSIEGSIDRRKLDLYFEIELLAASAGGFPEGTRFQFRYDLYRPYKRAADAGGRAPPGGCREVVYRNKLVPNLSGGAMGMVRVPECRR